MNKNILSNKYYSREDIIEIAKQANVPERFFEEYIVYVEDELKYFKESGDFDETLQDLGEFAIINANIFFKKICTAIQNGHTEEWSRLYASSYEEHAHAFYNAYQTIFKSNQQKAVEELLVYAKSVGGDKFYAKHLIYLMSTGEGVDDPDRKAETYSKIYKEQINLGKTEIFAHHYANQIASEFNNEAYCFSFAKYFENAIQSGKSEQYAFTYACASADYYGENYFYACNIDPEEEIWKQTEIIKFMESFEDR